MSGVITDKTENSCLSTSWWWRNRNQTHIMQNAYPWQWAKDGKGLHELHGRGIIKGGVQTYLGPPWNFNRCVIGAVYYFASVQMRPLNSTAIQRGGKSRQRDSTLARIRVPSLFIPPQPHLIYLIFIRAPLDHWCIYSRTMKSVPPLFFLLSFQPQFFLCSTQPPSVPLNLYKPGWRACSGDGIVVQSL